MNIERDQFLTIQMGECWHERVCVESGPMFSIFRCANCNAKWGNSYTKDNEYSELINNDFSTWNGFGKLWNWCKEQKVINVWTGKKDFSMIEMIMRNGEFGHDLSLINPDKFANAVYDFLKGESNEI